MEGGLYIKMERWELNYKMEGGGSLITEWKGGFNNKIEGEG